MKLLGDASITLRQAEELIKKYDKDGDSQINYEGKRIKITSFFKKMK